MRTTRLGRDKWLEHAQAWKKSGLSCAEYSKQEGLKASTLSWWTWKLRDAGEKVAGRPKNTKTPVGENRQRARRRVKKRKEEAPPVSFLELAPDVVESRVRVPSIELEVRGVVVRVKPDFDDAHLGRVLAVVEGRA